MKEQLALVIQLRSEGKLEQSRQLLLTLGHFYSNDSEVQFHCVQVHEARYTILQWAVSIK